MDEYAVVMMLRDPKTGILDREMGAYTLRSGEALLVNLVAEESGDGYLCRLKLTNGRNVADWEFEAIYDYYDPEVYGNALLALTEVEGCPNPTWELVFPFLEDTQAMEAALNRLLGIHEAELLAVYSAIEGREAEYAGQ